MTIQKNCLVLNLQIGTWLGYRLDKKTTAEVTETKGSASDALRVNKHLVTRESLAGISKADGVIRVFFYNNTLPWKDNGDRLITRAAFKDFIKTLEDHVAARAVAVEDFLTVKYPQEIARADFRMGQTFDMSDYPRASELRPKFYVNLDIDAVARAFDPRLDTDDEIIMGRVKQAMDALWKRIAEPLNHFATKVGKEDAIFRDSCVTNLQTVADMIPSLNFTDDPELEKMRQEIVALVGGVTPKELRKDSSLRKSVGAQAKTLSEQMGEFVDMFGGNDGDDE